MFKRDAFGRRFAEHESDEVGFGNLWSRPIQRMRKEASKPREGIITERCDLRKVNKDGEEDVP